MKELTAHPSVSGVRNRVMALPWTWQADKPKVLRGEGGALLLMVDASRLYIEVQTQKLRQQDMSGAVPIVFEVVQRQ